MTKTSENPTTDRDALLTIEQAVAASEFPLRYTTVYCWASKGLETPNLGRIYLKTERIGWRLYTKLSWLDDFLELSRQGFAPKLKRPSQGDRRRVTRGKLAASRLT